MDQTIFSHRFDNGLTLLAEPMPWLRSAAFGLLVPAGTWREPEDKQGLAGLTSDMVQRGAGAYSSRQLMERLDLLGVERDDGLSTYHTSFSATMMAEVLPDALQVYADILLSPHIPEDQLEESRAGALQELRGLEDELAQRCFRELKKLRYAGAMGRSPQGTWEGIESVTLSDVQQFHQQMYGPQDAILAVAGAVQWNELVEQVGKIFGKWERRQMPQPPPVTINYLNHHMPHASQQTHIALAYNSVSYGHPDYYRARGLVGVLSDGMSSRLFTEVREKRGLVYSVFAVPHSLLGSGSVLCYAGTTTQRAQETLDVTLQTIQSLGTGIGEDEVRRLKARVKSSLVMEQESSMGRAGQIASDWFHLQRVVTMQEVQREIDQLTAQSLQQYFLEHQPRDFTLVTLGEKELELNVGIPTSNAR